MDLGAYPDLEDDGSKEKSSLEYRPETKANREGATRQKAFSMGLSLDFRI